MHKAQLILPIAMNTMCAHLSLNQIALVLYLSNEEQPKSVPATTEPNMCNRKIKNKNKKTEKKTYIERDVRFKNIFARS